MEIKVFVEGPIDANNYLLIDEKSREAVLIDCSAPDADFIANIKNADVKLKYIFLTHGHFDHILGVDKFKEVFDVDTYMNKEDLSQVGFCGKMMQMFAGMLPVSIKTINHFVKDGDEFKFGDIEVKCISTPGHTKGGMSYLIDGKLFSGDTLFHGCVGRCDLPGGDLKAISHSIKDKLFVLPDETKVFPGHGSETTIGYEKKYNEILNI